MNTAFINNYLKEHLSEKRLRHIEGVRETAVRLAEIYGEDPEKAAFAALCHDMFKERDLNELVEKYGLPLKYMDEPNLAHSKVASCYMKEEMGIRDEDLLNAVSYHTTGRAGMSRLEKIIFLADAIEPGRDYPSADLIRKLAETDLDRACLVSLERTIRYLEEKGLSEDNIDPDTIDARDYFKRKEEKETMDNRQLALEAAKVLSDKQAEDIVVLDIAEKSSFADYLIIASGGSDRQTENMSDYVDERMSALGLTIKGLEGKRNTGWILMDYGDIIVSIFNRSMRSKYNLENVWADCERLDLGELTND